MTFQAILVAESCRIVSNVSPLILCAGFVATETLKTYPHIPCLLMVPRFGMTMMVALTSANLRVTRLEENVTTNHSPSPEGSGTCI